MKQYSSPKAKPCIFAKDEIVVASGSWEMAVSAESDNDGSYKGGWSDLLRQVDYK